MKSSISIVCILLLISLSYGSDDTNPKLVFIIADNSYANSSVDIPTNVQALDMKTKMKFLQNSSFCNIRSLSLILKKKYNNFNFEIEFMKNNIISELTGILLYEAFHSYEQTCAYWKNYLTNKWTKGGIKKYPSYVYSGYNYLKNNCNNYYGHEGELFIQNFIHQAKSIKNNKYIELKNKILSANSETFVKLIQKLNLHGINYNTVLSERKDSRIPNFLVFELHYNKNTGEYMITIDIGTESNKKYNRLHLMLENLNYYISIDQFENLLNIPNNIPRCNFGIGVSKILTDSTITTTEINNTTDEFLSSVTASTFFKLKESSTISEIAPAESTLSTIEENSMLTKIDTITPMAFQRSTMSVNNITNAVPIINNSLININVKNKSEDVESASQIEITNALKSERGWEVPLHKNKATIIQMTIKSRIVIGNNGLKNVPSMISTLALIIYFKLII